MRCADETDCKIDDHQIYFLNFLNFFSTFFVLVPFQLPTDVTWVLMAKKQKQNYSFSLQQAIEHALQNNYTAINANRDIASAKQKNGKQRLLVYPKLTVVLLI